MKTAHDKKLVAVLATAAFCYLLETPPRNSHGQCAKTPQGNLHRTIAKLLVKCIKTAISLIFNA